MTYKSYRKSLLCCWTNYFTLFVAKIWLYDWKMSLNIKTIKNKNICSCEVDFWVRNIPLSYRVLILHIHTHYLFWWGNFRHLNFSLQNQMYDFKRNHHLMLERFYSLPISFFGWTISLQSIVDRGIDFWFETKISSDRASNKIKKKVFTL